MRVPILTLLRREAWRLAKAPAPDLAAKAVRGAETRALDALLGLTGPGLKVDWAGLAFSSRYGGRFKFPGAHGALYAAYTRSVAASEAAFNWTRTFAETAADHPPGTRLALKVLNLRLTGAFTDVRKGHRALHDPDSHVASQVFGFRVQERGGDGIVYRSIRARLRGTCVVVFRRTALAACREAGTLTLVWDGEAFQVRPAR